MAVPFYEICARLEMLNLLRRIELNRLAANAGLHLGQLPVIEYIIRNDGCTQKEIADILKVTPASIAISTKRLQKAGLVKKSADESNLRCNRLSVTERGVEFARKCRDLFDEFDRKLFGGFSDDELAVMKSHLERLIANLSAGRENKIDFYSIIALKNEIERNGQHASTIAGKG